MKDMGMEKIFFDKYNTLVRSGETKFVNNDIKDAFIEAKEVFGKRNTYLIANLHPR